MKNILICILLIFSMQLLLKPACSQGLIINEFSNGPNGSKEYMEFLVVGTPCTTVDIRLWIFDDNNGVNNVACGGFGGGVSPAGVAKGHVRFKNIVRWSAVPVGSIILVYNPLDKNPAITLPDDPTDADADKVYILPVSDAGFQECAGLPVDSVTVNCGYSPALYATTNSLSWDRLTLRNKGDAAQTRRPNGTYFHGLSYGTAFNNMTGGPDNLKVLNGDGTGKVFSFLCDDYRNVANYISSNSGAGETPGYANSSVNQNFINYLRCVSPIICSTPLPVSLLYFIAKPQDNSILLEWITASETNNDYFTVERSDDGVNFTDIIDVPGAGNSTVNKYYSTIDKPDVNKRWYYRLRQTDFNGDNTHSKIVHATLFGNDNIFIYPDPSNGDFNIEIYSQTNSRFKLNIYNAVGGILYSSFFGTHGDKIATASVSSLPIGMYILEITNKLTEKKTYRIIVVK